MKVGKVEKTKIVPPRKGALRASYPWAEMQPGDHFLVTIDDGDNPLVVRGRVSSAANNYAKKYGGGYTTAYVYDARGRGRPSGVRVWRRL